jgi:hypothetical protein
VLHQVCAEVACNTGAFTLQPAWIGVRAGRPKLTVVRHDRVTRRTTTFRSGDTPMSNEILNDESLNTVVGGHFFSIDG